jgi:hypothetical protein
MFLLQLDGEKEPIIERSDLSGIDKQLSLTGIGKQFITYP